MAKVIVEYEAIVQKEMEIPDDVCNALVYNTEDFEEWKRAAHFIHNLWEQVAANDKNFIDPHGIYTADNGYVVAEY